MFYTIFLTVIINITIIVIGYKIISSKLEKKIFNKHIIEQVKEEINKIIINLNRTTTDNISLMENRINKINKLLLLTDKKIKTMNKDFKVIYDDKKTLSKQLSEENFIYSPKKIVNQSQKIAENKDDDSTNNFGVNGVNDKLFSIEKKIEDLPIDEKVKYLLANGKTKNEIKKIVGLSSGELELLLNISQIK